MGKHKPSMTRVREIYQAIDWYLIRESRVK
jgi:hypothetical protein